MRRTITLALLSCVAGLGPLPAAAAPGGPLGGPVVFEPRPGSTLTVGGRGALEGVVEVRRAPDGLLVVNELGLDAYVGGIREVPRGWPLEALKAQAVAARTYALWEASRGHWQRQGFDICGTTACQVYAGAIATRGRYGERWLQAVRATAGEVLLHDGEPALTRYHSSSGGRTLANEVVYPSEGRRPYLRAVDDPFDRVSPLHRWTATFRRDRLEHILRVAVGLAGTLVDVTSDQDDRRVTIRTRGGRLEMSSVRFRREVSDVAPRLYPDDYPGIRSDGQPMPFTLPSSRFDIERTDEGFRVEGRGYGHGVGMSQWGAKGRAEAGHDYREILAAYYGGLEPRRWDGRDTIRVAAVRGAPTALVWGDGPFTVRDGDDVLADSTLGTWSLEDAGAAIDVVPPRGHDLPLVLSDLRAPSDVLVDPPDHGRSLDLTFVVPKAASVDVVVRRGDIAVARGSVVADAGAGRVSVPLDPGRLARRDRYTVDVVASDGTDQVRERLTVTLRTPGPGALTMAGLALVLVVAAAAVYRIWRDKVARPSGRSDEPVEVSRR